MTEPFTICQLGDPVLRHPAQPIEQVQAAEVQTLIAAMIHTLTQSQGVGLAAPQVGRSLQLLIVASHPNARYPHAPNMDPVAMINPRLLAHSDDIVSDWEGCLSIPGIRGWVPRYREIEVEYTAQDGRLHQQQLTDFVARIFQHELDHLQGLVFLDRLASVRDIITDREYLTRVVASTVPAVDRPHHHVNRETD